MDKLSSVLPKVLHRRGIATHANGALAVFRATAWIGQKLPHLASFIRIVKLQEGVIHIECEHSVALQECTGVAPELLQYLRIDSPFEGIRDVRITRA